MVKKDGLAYWAIQWDWLFRLFRWMPEGLAAQREKAFGFECVSPKTQHLFFILNNGRDLLDSLAKCFCTIKCSKSAPAW